MLVHSCHDALPSQKHVLCCTFGQDYSGQNLKPPTAKESNLWNISCGEDHGRYTCCEVCIRTTVQLTETAQKRANVHMVPLNLSTVALHAEGQSEDQLVPA